MPNYTGFDGQIPRIEVPWLQKLLELDYGGKYFQKFLLSRAADVKRLRATR